MKKVIGLCVGLILCLSLSAIADEEKPATKEKVDLGKVVVTASNINQLYKYVPNNISIITSEDLESQSVNEVTEALNKLPALDVIEYGSLGSNRSVHVRGASSSQVLTMIDGRPVNTPRDGQTDFNQISLSNIDRIEVLRGPASNIYGSGAIGGVINVITKKGKEKMQTEALFKQGSFATSMESFSNSWKIKNFDYFLSYDYANSHGHRENAGYFSHNINSKIGYDITDNDRIDFSSGYFKSKIGNPGPVDWQDLSDKTHNYNNFFDFTYNGKVMDKVDILLKFYNNKDRMEFIETPEPIVKDTHLTRVYGFNSQASVKIFEFFRNSFGFDYIGNYLDSTTSAKHKYNLKAAYFESQLDLLDIADIKMGARWDDYSNFGDRISPSGSMNIWILDKIKIHGLAAKSFRAPTFNDLYWPRRDYGWGWGEEGNPNLGPEKAFSFEGGIATYFLESLKTDVTFFKTRYVNLIEWISTNGTWWTVENVGSALIEGIEFEIDYTPFDKLKINSNYTYLQAEDLVAHNDLIYRPKHLFKFKINYQPFKVFEVNTDCLYKDYVYTNKPNTTKLSPYFIMNMNFVYKLNKFSQLLFEAKNIFDRSYQEEQGYSMPGRSFYGGVRLNF